MQFEESQLILLLSQLSDEEKAKIKTAFQKQYGVRFELTPTELSDMNLEMLISLYDSVRGFLLTKQNAPNMRDAYKALKSKNLPRKVSFGRLDTKE